jgi:hypothetical protein
MKHLTLALLLTFSIANAKAADTTAPTATNPTTRPSSGVIISPDVHPDGSVTFRFRDPNANSVVLALEGAKGAPMQKDDLGIWSVTTPPLEPDFYGYMFRADGVGLLDPSNCLPSRRVFCCAGGAPAPGV